MKHFTIWYINTNGKGNKIQVLAHSVLDAMHTFNASRKLLRVRKVIAISLE